MLWLLRLAGVVGMVLAMTLFIWVFADYRHYFGDVFQGRRGFDVKEFKDGIHKMLLDLYLPCIWFGWAGMLYILAHTAMRKRPFPPAQAGGYVGRYTASTDYPQGMTRNLKEVVGRP
jgi:hypothetical protein